MKIINANGQPPYFHRRPVLINMWVVCMRAELTLLGLTTQFIFGSDWNITTVKRLSLTNCACVNDSDQVAIV